MAIIIPSKNIYEINNQKVVDNEVDNIEVEAKNVQQKNEYNIVVHTTSYEEKNDFVAEKQQENNNLQSYPTNDYSTIIAVAYASVTPTYLTKTINIPILQKYSYVQKIILGVDANDKPNIRYTIYGTVTTETANAIVHVEKEKFDTIKDFSFSNPSVSDIKPYELNNKIETEKYEGGGIINHVEAKAEIQLDDISNLATLTEKTVSIDGIDYFQIKATVLCGQDIIKIGGVGSADHGAFQLATTDISVNGTHETYTPKKIEINIYGNTIGISLEDETVKIGDGQHVYSFNGNELMQITNVPTIENTYQSIINEWKDGKETAVIKCGIAEYYISSDGTSEVRISSISNPSPFSCRINGILIGSFPEKEKLISLQITIDENKYSVSNITLSNNNTMISGDINIGSSHISIGEAYSLNYKYRKLAISPMQNGFPKTIHIGDVVCPYIMDSNGNDKPMSLYANKTTAKEFLVIGKGIIADGEIMQELTLQEIPKN